MSNLNLDQLANSQKANAEVMMTLVRSAFNGMEQLAALNLAASREFFNASVANTQQLMNAKDPQELSKLSSSLAQPNVEKMTEYSRRIADLVTGMQKEITSVMEAQYSTFTKTASSAIEKSGAAAPVGGDVFAAAMKQMLQASTKAYDNMSQMAKQMTDIAEANVKTATSATTKAAAASKKK
jgi:phasin family protein